MKKDHNKLLGERILELRKEQKKTQVSLATAIGVTKSMLSKYENGINIPKADIVALIADELNTSTDYLLGRRATSIPQDKDELWYRVTEQELEILNLFKTLNDKDQGRVLERALTIKESSND